MTPVRRPGLRVGVRLVVAVVVAVLATTTAGGAAQAAGFRFWGFYTLTDGTWAFATEGPAATIPKDGAVEGWRFAISEADDVRYPRAVLDFAAICGSTPAAAGSKRVGVVVDFGRPADGPDGATPPEPTAACAVVPEDASSLEVLTTVTGDARMSPDSTMLCAVAGYPATGCGDAAEVSPEAKAPDEPVAIAVSDVGSTPGDSASPSGPAPSSTTQGADDAEDDVIDLTWPILGGLVLLILVVLGLAMRSRRRTDGQEG